ncbi:LppX_LprAFG lipoprotein [Ilumatobacter sp.]|uniref:LppX_LprAFG lipoprotein n=1 Tax=Ilumatobacter sp. TaxID=1967498 RepID=UPI003B518978
MSHHDDHQRANDDHRAGHRANGIRVGGERPGAGPLRRSTTRRIVVSLAAGALAVAACSGDEGEAEEPTEPTIPADAEQIVAASAQAMGDTTSVRFRLERGGAPVFIDPAEAVSLSTAAGEFTVPRSARALLEVEVAGDLATELGAVAIDDEVWLSNPITGRFETLPPGYDIDPSLFFDPEDGWRPLMESLDDVELVGSEERGGGQRYHVTGTAPAEQVETITARLVRGQEVEMDFWIQPVTGEVRSAEFTTQVPDGAVTWVLELSGYGEEFDIGPPEGVET